MALNRTQSNDGAVFSCLNRYDFTIGGVQHDVAVEHKGGAWRILADGECVAQKAHNKSNPLTSAKHVMEFQVAGGYKASFTATWQIMSAYWQYVLIINGTRVFANWTKEKGETGKGVPELDTQAARQPIPEPTAPPPNPTPPAPAPAAAPEPAPAAPEPAPAPPLDALEQAQKAEPTPAPAPEPVQETPAAPVEQPPSPVLQQAASVEPALGPVAEPAPSLVPEAIEVAGNVEKPCCTGEAGCVIA